jgi:TP901 family phage tail tape measure protein
MANKYAVETAFKLIDRATEPLTKIGVKGNAIGKALKKDFMKAQDQLASLGKAAVKAGAAIAAAGAAAVTAWAVKGVKDAIEYDTALRKVSTVADTTAVSMDELSKGLMKVSNETGTAVAELADLQYSAIVSGIKTADSVGFVETAVKAATASFTDTATVIDGLTAVLNAYGMEASEAGKIAGQMLITNNLGKTSFEELNGALGKVLPTAARLNVGTDELFASLTALTANSIETPKAVKGLEKILETVQRPTDAAAKAARRLGIDFSVSAIRSKGLAGFLNDIQEKTGGSEEAIMSLFGSVESLNAITVLTGKGAGQFTEALSEMQNATEKLNSAFETIDASPAERWGDIVNIIKNAGINLGTKLLPIIEKVTVKVEEVVGKLQDYDFTPVADKIGVVFDKIIKTGEFFVWLAGVVWKLRVPILSLVAAWGIYKTAMLTAAASANIIGLIQPILSLAKAQKGMNAAQAVFNHLLKTNPVGLIIAAIGILIGLFVLLYTKCEPFRNFINGLFEKIKEFGNHVIQIFTPALEKVKDVFQNITSVVGEIIRLAVRLVSGFLGLFGITDKVNTGFTLFEGILKIVSTTVQIAWTIIGGLVNQIGALFSGINDIMDAFKNGGFIEGIQQIGKSILSYLLTPLKNVLEIASFIPGIGKLAKSGAEKIGEFQDSLRYNQKETTLIQKVVPAGISNVTPRSITQTTAAANAAVSVPGYGVDNRNNRTITAAAAPVTAPMTTAEQYMYSQTTSREQIDIGVRAEPGTSARVTRGRRRSPNIRVESSGGNNG